MRRSSPDSLRHVVAGNVRRMRRLKGWSQEELAAQAQLHRTYVGSIERAERNLSIDNIERLAVALMVEPWSLLKPEGFDG